MFSKLGLKAEPVKTGKDDFTKAPHIKFKKGTKTVGVFVGEPIKTFVHWKEYVPGQDGFLGICTGENCTFCQEGNRPSEGIEVNFLTVIDGQPTMTVAQGPKSLGIALTEKEEVKGEGFFEGTVVMINRTDNTAFAIDDLAKDKIPEGLKNLKAILKEAPTVDLAERYEARVKKQMENADTSSTAPYSA